MQSLGILSMDERALALGGCLSHKNNKTFIFETKQIKVTDRCSVKLRDDDGVFRSYPILSIADDVDFRKISKLINPAIKIYVININAHKLSPADYIIESVFCH